MKILQTGLLLENVCEIGMLHFIRPVLTHVERRVVVLPRSTGADVVESQTV